MTPIFPELPHSLGVYTLNRLLLQRGQSEVYAASQSHVEREVALELLRPAENRAAAEAAFVATARARVAAGQLPQVGQVFESLCVDGYWFMTQELPVGMSLAALAAEKHRLPVLVCVQTVAVVAEIEARCESAGRATLLPDAAAVFVAHGAVNCLSPVTTGAFDAASVAAHQRALADMVAAVAPGKGAGTTRLLTLLSWLREGYEGRCLSWAEVLQTAQMLQQQLSAPTVPTATPSSAGLRRKRGRAWRRLLPGLGCALAGVALIAGLTAIGSTFRTGKTVEHAAVSRDGIACQAGDGVVLLSAAPVTVAQYAQFLSRQTAEAAMRPADWERQKMLPNEPVVGVTYDQAMAYALSCGGKLPTVALLQAAFGAGAQHPLREWSADTFQGAGYGVIEPGSPLAVSPTAPFAPIPLPHDPSYADSELGFRVAQPAKLTE